MLSVAASESLAAESSTSLGEDDFCRLYELTARPLRAYLRRVLVDSGKADDVLQDSYLRFILARLPAAMTFEHQKNYLFRIASNLCCDEARRKRTLPLVETSAIEQPAGTGGERRDVERMLRQLEPRERQLLWLAYVERFSHQEIAGMVGAKATSIRSMLFRARSRFSKIMQENGFGPERNCP